MTKDKDSIHSSCYSCKIVLFICITWITDYWKLQYLTKVRTAYDLPFSTLTIYGTVNTLNIMTKNVKKFHSHTTTKTSHISHSISKNIPPFIGLIHRTTFTRSVWPTKVDEIFPECYKKMYTHNYKKNFSISVCLWKTNHQHMIILLLITNAIMKPHMLQSVPHISQSQMQLFSNSVFKSDYPLWTQ